MRRLFIVVGAVLLLVGCTQTEGRYEIVKQSPSSAWLVDRSNGCVWLFALKEGFLPVNVMGLHEGKFLEKAEGCPKGG